MSKLNLANLAQNQVTQDEAQRVKGGVYCSCTCICGCFGEIRIDIRIQTRLEEYDFISVG